MSAEPATIAQGRQLVTLLQAQPAAPRPRTTEQMYGAGVGLEETPGVTREIDGEDYYVDVDLTPAADVLIEALAAAVANDEALAAEWFVLMLNRSTDATRRRMAVHDLLRHPQVRRALTIRLAPETADQLRERLDNAQLEPARCGVGGGVRSPEPGCGNYVEDGMGGRCPAHADGGQW